MQEEKRPDTADAAGKTAFKDEAEVKGFRGIIKGGLPLLYGALTVTVVNILFSLFSLMTLGLEGSKLWLGILLYVLFAGCDILFIFMIGRSQAYTAYNVSRLNRVNRNAGRNVPRYKRMREYKPYKGYLTGLCGSALLILLVLVSLCIPASSAGYVGFTGTIKFIYCIFAAPFIFVTTEINVALVLVGVVVNVLSFGIGYQLFGNKMQLQQEAIDEEMRKLHSENFDVDGSDRTDV